RLAGHPGRPAGLRGALRRPALPARRATLLSARGLPRGGGGDRHPGVLRLRLGAESRGPACAALGAGTPPARGDGRARRCVAPAGRGSRGGPGLPRQVLGRAPPRRRPAVPRGLAPWSSLAPPPLALPRGTRGPGRRDAGSGVERAARMALAGAPL